MSSFIDSYLFHIERIKVMIKKRIEFDVKYSLTMKPEEITHICFVSRNIDSIKLALDGFKDIRQMYLERTEREGTYGGGGKRVHPMPSSKLKTPSLFNQRDEYLKTIRGKIDEEIAQTIYRTIGTIEASLHSGCKTRLLTYMVFNSETNNIYLVFIVIHFDTDDEQSIRNFVVQKTAQNRECVDSQILHLISNARTVRPISVSDILSVNDLSKIRRIKNSPDTKN